MTDLRWLGGVAILIAQFLLPPAEAGELCCGVVAIDKDKGTVTLKSGQTGKTTTVRIQDSTLLDQLKVGQKVQGAWVPAACPPRCKP
jgi:hypothetical protein